MGREEIETYKAQIGRLRQAESKKEWVHHVADLSARSEVVTRQLDRPILLDPRVASIADTLKVDVSNLEFTLAERQLTPRAPYQASPLSYLNAFGRSWSLHGEANRLEWAEFGAEDARYGGIEFWFRNPTVGKPALVTIEVTASTTSQNTTGHLEVRSSDASPRTFPVSTYSDHTLDLVVTPDMDYATLVSLEVGSGISYLAFKEATYRTL